MGLGWVGLGWGGGGRVVKPWLAYRRHCVSIQTQAQSKSFPILTVPGSISRFPTLAPRMGPHGGGLGHFQVGMGWLKNLDFWVPPTNPGTLRPLLGDHLVTKGVRITHGEPCGTKLALLVVPSGPQNRRFWPICTVVGKTWLASLQRFQPQHLSSLFAVPC